MKDKIIPTQLQKPEFKFYLLKPKDKIPFEKNWQNSGYKFGDSKLINHINNGGNYGVIGGYGNLIILDKDDDKLNIDIDTFTIKTGSGGKHYYLISPYKENHVFVNELGELRSHNYQCVGEGCIHPNGNKYEIEKDIPIKHISSEDVKKIIEPYLRDGVTTETSETKGKDTSNSGEEFRDILSLLNKGKTKEDILQIMRKYSKWSNAPIAYKEMTYKKANDLYLESIKKKKKK